MKKLVSLLLAVAMLLACASALAEIPEGFHAEGMPIVDEPITISVLTMRWGSMGDSFKTNPFLVNLEKESNVKVDWQIVSSNDWADNQKPVMLAGGESALPEVVLGFQTFSESDIINNVEYFLPLEDLIEQYMPNLTKAFEEMPALKAISTSADGHIYSLPSRMPKRPVACNVPVINVKWLENLGLEVPTTIDEYTNVLRKFKEAGIKYPLSTSTFGYGPETIWNEFASFGVPENYAFYHITDDDKLEFTGTMPGWRACVEWLHMLYEEGLLDPECLTQDSNLWANKVNAGEVASFPYLRLINTALTPDVYKDFKSILPPADPTYGAAVSAILEVPEQGAILTSTNANPVASLKWIDAQLETETMMVAANGKVGEQIQLNAEGKYEVINVPENNGLYSFVPVTMGQFFAPGEYYTQIYQMAPHRVERYLDSEMYAAAGVLEHKSYQYVSKLSKMDNEDSIEAANIYTELKKFMEESVTDFIKNGVTDESYNKFVETAKAIGVERYIELYQNAYDAYLAK